MELRTNKLGRIAVVVASVLALTSCSSSKKQETQAPSQEKTPESWSGKMQELYSTVSTLGTYIYDEQAYNDPKNFDEIKHETKKLSNLAHSLDMKEKPKIIPNEDPALAHFASQFRDDLNRAYESLETDHRAYARTVLKTSLSYCISCHTRTESGPQFPLLTNSEFAMKLQPMERARFYTATRQFDAGLKQFIDILKDPETGKRRPFDIERAARSALAIAVRVKNDPKVATEVANLVISKPDTPLFVKNDAEGWAGAINEWKKDKATPSTEAAFVQKIKALLAKGDKQQRYPADIKGDIYYLRATSLIHEYFSLFKEPKSKNEVFYLGGRAYEALRELGFWTLHELYYEQCVRQAAHTGLARKCYEELEQSILLGYSGSAGLFLPVSVRKQLEELRALTVLK